jgi:hypothetical protein
MKRGKKATLIMNGVETPAEIVSEPGVPSTLPRDSRTPLFYVEVDLTRAAIHATFQAVPDELSDVVGLVAKQLHDAAHLDHNIHKAFVYKSGHYYVFEFHRTGAQIVATLTALSDHRVRVTYHNGKEPETLYL